MKYQILLLTLLITQLLHAQSYESWITGDTTDVSGLSPTPGIVLAGGAGDSDEAMQWMLERADGGDVVVIRASGSDGYNSYFYSELGVTVNSVQTILFNAAEAAQDAYVIEQIRNAECLFIAGGDQYVYYQYWKDSPIEDAINYLIHEKGVPVGGTSAGMAILSNCYYAPSGSSLTADEALSNPYHPDFDILGKDDFLNVPYTDNLVTDTHYDQRERPGRHIAMMARIAQDHQTRSFGIACNEYTAVCIDENGQARAFGEFADYPEDIVYFLQANCQDEFLPEVISEGMPLSWVRGQNAVKAYAVPAYEDGTGTFDLNNWQDGVGGFWQNWYVDDGVLFQEDITIGGCDEVISHTKTLQTVNIKLFPNPTQEYLYVEGIDLPATATITNVLGEVVVNKKIHDTQIQLPGLPSGHYHIFIAAPQVNYQESFIIKQP
jgi:cyanophycinase-like exopeptidase